MRSFQPDKLRCGYTIKKKQQELWQRLYGILRKPVGATVNIYFSDRRYLIILRPIKWRPPDKYVAAAR